MTFKSALFASLFALACPVHAEVKLAILGLSEEKSLESVAVQLAVDASNNSSVGSAEHLRPWYVALTHSAESNLRLAERIAADREVLGVILHGEAAASPDIIDVFRRAGLATVSASSWAQARPKEVFVNWLCPSGTALAESAALYARREARQSQVAVLDNGAPTAAAAAQVFANKFRSLGGKVVFEGEWQGSEWGLTRTARSLKANWPQMLFFAGDGAESGRLVAAMKEEKELKSADLIGQPTVFDPAFFNTARTKATRTRGFFPCPDFVGTQPLVRLIGIAFPRTSAEYRAYVQVAYKKPGRWAAMLFDATALLARSVREAQSPGSTRPLKSAALPAALSPTAARDSDLTATVTVETATTNRLPGRDDVQRVLLSTESYRGIRGVVHFSPSREPTEAKAMVYYALTKVNKKEMQWREKNYGPPF